MKALSRTASFRPRVQTRKGSLAGFGIVGNGLVLALLPLFLVAFMVTAPLLLTASAVLGVMRGVLAPEQEAG